MTMTSVDLDADLLDAATHELGTKTKRETITQALTFVVEQKARARHLLQPLLDDDQDWKARLGLGEDIDNPEVMRGARR